MVPVQSLEATSNVFVGHRWGTWMANPMGLRKRATRKDIRSKNALTNAGDFTDELQVSQYLQYSL
jgi:hypothetical protein